MILSIPLDQVIDVDYYLPGCAPPPDLIMKAIEAILSGNLPPKGSVLAPDKSLCDTCKRKMTKPEKAVIKEIKRVHEVLLDPGQDVFWTRALSVWGLLPVTVAARGASMLICRAVDASGLQAGLKIRVRSFFPPWHRSSMRTMKKR